MSHQKFLFWACLAASLHGTSAFSQTVIGIVTDGPEARSRSQVELAVLEREVQDLLGSEFDVSFPPDKQLNGGWELETVRDALEQQLSDPDVDILLTLGVAASNEVAQMELSKPVVAAATADAELQELPIDPDTGGSGKNNFVYLSNFHSIDEEAQVFRDSIEFDHFVALVDPLTLESIPSLASTKVAQISDQLGIRISLVQVTDSVDEALAAIPGDAEAVYVTPLLRLDDEDMVRLADGLIQLGLPSFSLIGRGELDYGLLMAIGGREEDEVRFTRRLALNIQRILLGQNASEIPVSFQESRRLSINMRTARAIGFSPRYAVTTNAELLNLDEIEAGDPLDLVEAMAEALEANLDLKVAEFDPLLATESVRAARSGLMPQFSIGFQGNQIDEDRANPLFQSERTTDAQISGSQVIYSDDFRASLEVATRLANSSDYELHIAVLDVLQSAATNYLNVLRARAAEAVQRSNLEVTRTNLELANIREQIGISGRGDVLRWESQLAVDLQNLIAAEANRRIALTEFNRILNREQYSSFASSEEDLTRIMSLFVDERFRVFIDNPAVWELLQTYFVEVTLRDAPELRSIDQIIVGQERQVLSSRRKFYVPELALVGTAGNILSRSGVGSMPVGIDDESWSLALTATWPLFTSGALRARLNQDQFGLQQLESQRSLLEQQLEARTRLALYRAASSHPAMELSENAARAASENLVLITDAYSRGVMTVTDLINAQDAALTAELRAADARFAFLIDVIGIFRSTSDFSVLLDPGRVEPWYQEIEAYFVEQGIAPQR